MKGSIIPIKCENCIHYDVCNDIDDGLALCLTGGKGCNFFKDKTRYVEITSGAKIAQAPCDMCKHYPPSSGDGKPCGKCPAIMKNAP